MSKPRLCEILGVEVDQDFMVKGFEGSAWAWESTYHVDSDGYFVREYGQGDIDNCNVLCYLIKHPDEISHNTRWTEKDKTDAKAIKQLWPVANRLNREGIKITVKFASVLLGKDDITLLDIWNEKLFPSLKDGETVDLDEILEDKHE